MDFYDISYEERIQLHEINKLATRISKLWNVVMLLKATKRLTPEWQVREASLSRLSY